MDEFNAKLLAMTEVLKKEKRDRISLLHAEKMYCRVHTRSDQPIPKQIVDMINVLELGHGALDYKYTCCEKTGYRYEGSKFLLYLRTETKVVGKVEFSIDGEECFVEWILGPCFGTILMAKLEKYLLSKNIKSIKLKYLPTIKFVSTYSRYDAEKFYKKVGFKKIGTENGFVIVRKFIKE